MSDVTQDHRAQVYLDNQVDQKDAEGKMTVTSLGSAQVHSVLANARALREIDATVARTAGMSGAAVADSVERLTHATVEPRRIRLVHLDCTDREVWINPAQVAYVEQLPPLQLKYVPSDFPPTLSVVVMCDSEKLTTRAVVSEVIEKLWAV